MRAWDLSAPASPRASPGRENRSLAAAPPLKTAVGVALALCGAVLIAPTLHLLWGIWMGDPLKSIGALVLPVSFLLILRVWRASDWPSDGTWWGVALLLAVFCAVQLRERAVLVLVLSPSISLSLPPLPLLVFAYVSGMVLAVGGPALYRAALFSRGPEPAGHAGAAPVHPATPICPCSMPPPRWRAVLRRFWVRRWGRNS